MNRLSLWLTLIFNYGICFAIEVIGEVLLSFGAGRETDAYLWTLSELHATVHLHLHVHLMFILIEQLCILTYQIKIE